MFDEDDVEKIEDLKEFEIKAWSAKIEALLDKRIQIIIDWESTYTLPPVAEPDFRAAGKQMIEAFELACKDEATQKELSNELNRIEFVSVSPHIGYGVLAEGSQLQYRTTVYPQADGTEMSTEIYADMIRDTALELEEG
ncbi:MAG: hypothetical protein ACI97A_003692 [Planctomycetota bacterium]|jgi:hypothetical protein